MTQQTPKFRRACASIVAVTLFAGTTTVASSSSAIAADSTAVSGISAVDVGIESDAAVAATPAVAGAAFVAAAGAFALKAVYDVGVAAGEWACRKIAGRFEEQLDGGLQAQAVLLD